MGNSARRIAYKLTSVYGDRTVEEIVSLANSRGIAIAFVYLPEFAYATDPKSDDLQFYADLAPIIVPPQGLTSDHLNWWDSAHLNRTGSLKLVATLRSSITELLKTR